MSCITDTTYTAEGIKASQGAPTQQALSIDLTESSPHPCMSVPVTYPKYTHSLVAFVTGRDTSSEEYLRESGE